MSALRPAGTARLALVLALTGAMGLAGVLACAHVERAGPVQFASSVKFRDAAGEVSFRIKPEDGDVRVEDDDGDLLVELRAQAAGLAISSGRRDLGLVQPLEGRPGFRVVTEQGGDTVLELRIEPDGDLSLRDGAGEHLYKAKRRDYGFKILDAEGNVQAKVRSRSRSTKTAVRNAAGETYLSTRDPIPAAAVATLALDDVRFAHAVALAVAIVHWGIPGAPGATLEEAAPES